MTFDEWLTLYPADYAAHIASMIPPCDGIGNHEQTESNAQALVRLEASRKGKLLFRNNVGAGTVAESGSFVRWGLANDSKAVNSKLKSGDLIGIQPVLITQAHVGTIIGQFLSREIKAPGWKYHGTDRELAQIRWAELILARGGDAAIVTGPGSL